jgi:hypothetical protein
VTRGCDTRRQQYPAVADPGGVLLKYSHPVLAVFLHYWPTMVLLPALLLVIASLAFLTRWWDRRDEAHRHDAPAAH